MTARIGLRCVPSAAREVWLPTSTANNDCDCCIGVTIPSAAVRALKIAPRDIDDDNKIIVKSLAERAKLLAYQTKLKLFKERREFYNSTAG
jgi:hypothetical protein